jgi:hypothetical protein
MALSSTQIGAIGENLLVNAIIMKAVQVYDPGGPC